MLAFDPIELSSRNITDLAPRQLFCYSTMGESRLALNLTPRNSHPIWLNLTGKQQYQLDTFDRPPVRMRVLPLPLSPDALRVRADFSAVSHDHEHRLGQLVVAPNQRAGIAVRWPNSDEFDRYLVECDTLEFREEHEVSFRISRWSLSFVDESGRWSDAFVADVSAR